LLQYEAVNQRLILRHSAIVISGDAHVI